MTFRFKSFSIAPKKLVFIGGGVVFLLVGLSKFFSGHKETVHTPAAFKVYASPSKAMSEVVTIRTSGISKASRKINLISETSGQIYRQHHKKGHILNEKDPVVTIQLDDRSQQLKEAKANYNLAKEKLDVTKKLAAGNFRSGLNLKTAQVEYESAAARLARVEKEIENTQIVAPFKGVLGDVLVEEGSVLAPGVPVATLLNLDPLLIQIYIPENDYKKISLGQAVELKFTDEEKVSGKISFVSSIADVKTHMFLIEATIDNEGFKIPDGVTVQANIPTAEQKVHKINPSVLSIDQSGKMSVKVLNADKVVESYPINLVHSVGDAIWVTGLPDETVIINYGGHFVNVGEKVEWEPLENLKGTGHVQ